MKVYKEKYVADAYRKILIDLLFHPEYISKPRNLEVKEITNCVIEIEKPNFNLFQNKVRSSPKKYISAELLWYFSGLTNAEFIEQYASLWSKLKDENNNVNSAYGYLIFNEETDNDDGYTQYEWVIERLKEDKDTRQAFMHFNKPRHQYKDNKDQVCTLIALFHIRDNKLNMTLTMRSNDVIFGFMTDFTFFNILHQQVFVHMKKYYPELKMGSYTHISHSMHLYEKHYEKVDKMLYHEFYPDKTPKLTSSIIDETGKIINIYRHIIFHPVIGRPITDERTDNKLLNWALDNLTKNK